MRPSRRSHPPHHRPTTTTTTTTTTLSLSLCSLLLLSLVSRGQAVQAENVTVQEGGTAQISCRLQNYDGSIVVIQNPRRQTLFFNGTRALKDDRFQMVLFTPRLVRITLTNVSVLDEGGYFCQLYTDDTHHQVATLSVVVPPETPIIEVNQEAVEGGEAKLTCLSPRSKPPASLRWMRNGREIPALCLRRRITALCPRRRITALCLRRVPIPESFSGDSLTLTCTVTGNPLPRIIQWSRVNDTLPERAEILGTTLVMSRLSQSHNGTYLCQAHNNHGRAADHYTLLVYENITVAPTSIPDSFIPTSLTTMFAPEPKDPGAVVETHSAVPYAVIGGVLALLVFTIICVLIATIWCSGKARKPVSLSLSLSLSCSALSPSLSIGSYLTHEASGLDEHGEVQEAFLNGNDTRDGTKKEYLL
ncbi:LOW QUALITY PROTEIN: cell adhesion molecule 4 [Alosa alosa]|uniref:LOW QUALITY PROTEIN: cell adhesion molecule 4 n=1 Tax=Alosa alosa TaxID=278164 RepID=UPI00201515BA|nr:LOW QUALITY PROTEIN: cell adhesion molecule 4 [Alosa alosa]